MREDEALTAPGSPGAPENVHAPGGTGGLHTVSVRPLPRQRRNVWLFSFAFLIIVAAAGWTIRHFEYVALHPYTDDASIKGDLVPISSKASGRVIRLLVDDNQSVQQGRLLFVLDATDAQIRVRQAMATLQAAQARVRQAQAALDAQQHQTVGTVAQAQAGVDVAAARLSQTHTAATLQKLQLEAELAQAEAALRNAEAQLSAARAQAAAATAEVNTATANVAVALAVLNRSQQDYRRARQLAEQGAVAAQQVDAAQAEHETAQAQSAAARASRNTALERQRAAQSQVVAAQQAVHQARARLDLVKAGRGQLQIRKQEVTAATAQQEQARANVTAVRSGRDLVRMRAADLAAAEAAVAQAGAQLAAAREELRNTSVTAPAAGIITQVTVQPGQLIQAGQPVLVLVPAGQRWVVAYFKETQIRHMRVGQPAIVRVDALRRSLRGHILSIGTATGSTFSLLPPENASGNYVKVVQRVPVRIVIDEMPDQALQLGLSVEVEVDTEPHKN